MSFCESLKNKVMAEKKKTKNHKVPTRLEKLLYAGSVSHKQLLFFTKNLSILLRSGSSLTEALLVLEDQSKGKLRLVLNEVNFAVQRGTSLGEAFSRFPKVFSPTYVSIIKIGEKSGTLEENIDYIADQLETSYQLRRKIRGAMLYPAIVMIAAILLGIAVTFFILPKLTVLFSNFDVELPLTTRILLAIFNFFQSYGFSAVLGLLALLIFLFWFLRLEIVHPVTHWLLLRIPIVSAISKNYNLALFSRTLGVLLRSGVTIDEGLAICSASVSNYYYKKHFKHAQKDVKGGAELTAVLREDKRLYPATTVQIVHVGERSGTLSDSLEYVSTIHENVVNDITKNLSSLLEPVLLLVIGVMVAILALAIITPIYSITGQFRQ